MSQQCKETFLEDVVRVRLVKSSACTFSIPACIPSVNSLARSGMGTAVVDVHLWDEDGAVAATGGNAFVVKQTVSRAGSKVIYVYNVEFTAQSGIDEVSRQVDSLMKDDYNIVLTKADGTEVLIYSLAGTFGYEHTRQGASLQVKASVKSYNGFIALT